MSRNPSFRVRILWTPISYSSVELPLCCISTRIYSTAQCKKIVRNRSTTRGETRLLSSHGKTLYQEPRPIASTMKKVVKSAFFYGTLMHPKILREVLRKKGKHLQICTALLMDYTRHQVKNADYPGIVPYEKGRKLIDRELEPEERCVRGTLVTGLTMTDIKWLDWFMTDAYITEVVSVYPLEELTALEKFMDDEGQNKNIIERIGHVQPRALDEILAGAMGAGVKAETYVYRDVGTLRPALWSFSEFVEKKAWKWYGWEDLEEEENEAPEPEIDGRSTVQ